jgi:protease-4
MSNLNPHVAGTILKNLGIALSNALANLPGERPPWLVIPLAGSYPARTRHRRLTEFPPDVKPPEVSQEALVALVRELGRAPWLAGGIFRLDELRLDFATAYALHNILKLLREAGKETVAYATQFDLSSYYLASVADRIAAPESAEFDLRGLSLETLFMRDALARLGIAADKVAIGAYKSAGDQFVRQELSEAAREQLSALLSSFERTVLQRIADGRKVSFEKVKSWIDQGVTSAVTAQRLGIIDRVAYEDELIPRRAAPLAAGVRFLRRTPLPVGEKRVAVISLEGIIVPGKSRRTPFPLPLIGDQQAGSETLLAAFRLAERDVSTAAIVFYVDSGGGSALASDLIWREVKRVGVTKPVVAVMGSVAASGGYYVLTGVRHIVAAPTTVTGSIGVLTVKFVLEQFYAQYGLQPEALSRGRFAQLYSANQPFSPEERELIERYIGEVYERFVARVAEGRRLSKEAVDALGQGRVWSGEDALARGLIDQLGDVASGLERAKALAGLHPEAPVWNVRTPARLLLPTSADPTTLQRALGPLLREQALLLSNAFSLTSSLR